jgi:YVTN family beta-propeller protein
MTRITLSRMAVAALLGTTALSSAAPAAPDAVATQIPTGQFISPLAIPGATQQLISPRLSTANNPDYANFVADEAARAELSPDGTTLAVITAGTNYLNTSTGALDVPNSTQYIFLYDVSTPATKSDPALKQVLKQDNAYVGLVWSSDGGTIYAAGGADDLVYVYTKTGGAFAQSATINLRHGSKGPFSGTSHGVGLEVESNAGALALSADDSTLLVANNYNDSVTVIDTATRTVRYEHDMRPYAAGNEGESGVAGGEYPMGAAIVGSTAYVSSARDREVVVLQLGTTQATLVKRIPLAGNGAGMTLSADDSKLYVAQDNADEVTVIDTATNAIIESIDARGPAGLIPTPPAGGKYTGAATFSARLSPDGGTLYAVNSGSNSVAVIPLAGNAPHHVSGLLPTAYGPKDVALSADGTHIYIINGKSDQGPNPLNLYGFGSNTALLTQTKYPGGNAAADAASQASNEYQFQLERSSLVSAPVPTAAELPALTAQVAQNNGYSATLSAADQATMSFLHSHIKHVIYIVKENRTYDQVLGDLTNGSNGDPSLTIFGRMITPNFHKIASNFVTLDNFMDPGDGSMDGWSWSTQARITTTEELNQQLNYANVDRGVSYDTEGANRNAPILATPAARAAAIDAYYGPGLYEAATAPLPGGTANVLPGLNNHTATDAPFGLQKGYIYDAVLNAGLTVRNYGFLCQNTATTSDAAFPGGFPNPGPGGADVVQVSPLDPSLLTLTDVYFRGFDQTVPDLWRFNEWNREFQQYVADYGTSKPQLPSLETVRFSHDHTGSFSSAQAKVNTPELMQADNDVSVGKLIQAVANSPYADSTLILVTEDDSQDGPDHVDSHRETAYAAGAFVKKGAVVSTRYSQINMLRTIEDIVGTTHINMNTAFARPMVEIFDTAQSPSWSYAATASTLLKATTLSLALLDDGVKFAEGPDLRPTHDASYWERATKGFDFSDADRVPPAMLNQALWAGMTDGKPYPAVINASDDE